MFNDEIFSRFDLLCGVIAIVSLVFQCIPSIGDNIKIFFLIIVGLYTLFLIIFKMRNRKTVSQKKLVDLSNRLLHNTSSKAVLMGKDLSWTERYIKEIEYLTSESKTVEVYFPIDILSGTNKDIVLERLYKLDKAGAELFYLPDDSYHLRCTLIDPDPAQLNHFKFISTDRKSRPNSVLSFMPSIKFGGKFRIIYYKYARSNDMCHLFLNNYYLVKKVAEVYICNHNSNKKGEQ